MNKTQLDMIKNIVRDIVDSSVDEYNKQVPKKKRISSSIDAKLFGTGGVLDSLGLVNFIVLLEQKLDEKLNINVTLADERAMSQKNSPFRSLDSIIEYILFIIKDNDSV